MIQSVSLTRETPLTMPLPMNYRQVADDLSVRIASGEYAPGDRLPSYREMRDLYGIGSTTTARVYALLVERDIAVGVPGVGVFVATE